MLTRREKILVLLEHLEDYEPAPAGGTATGDGTSTPRLPDLVRNYRSIQALLRTLDQLRIADRTAYAHLIAKYKPETRTVNTCREIRAKSQVDSIICKKCGKRTRRGHYHDDGPRKREPIGQGWIINLVVKRGEDWIDNNYPKHQDPEIPCEFTCALHCESGCIRRRRRKLDELASEHVA